MPDLELVARRLRLDAAVGQVVAALRDRGIRAVLLKGQAVEAVLYERFERQFGDIDLLVDPALFTRAGDVLESVGYSRVHGSASLGEASVHAREFTRRGVFVDLHHHVPGIGAPPVVAWPEWLKHAVAAGFPGGEVEMLGHPAVLLMVCLGAARAGEATADLQRAVALAPDEEWQRAWSFARVLDADGPMALALAMFEAGQEVLCRNRFEALDPAGGRLLAAREVPLVDGLIRLRGTPGLFRRAALLGRELVPSPDGLRYWRPAAGRSRAALAGYYVYRPIYLVTRLPRAVIRFWRAVGR